MCDASDFIVGVVLGKRKDKVFHAIYYGSRTMTNAYYLAGTKATIYMDHSAIKYLVTKKDAKPRKRTENQVADHLSRLEAGNEDRNIQLIIEDFPDEQLLVVTALPWYSDIVNVLISGLLPPDLNSQIRRKFLHDAKQHYWDESFLFKHCPNQIT
ncbi:Transposon Ty3-I Gag-Pol polyprotein [Gossypium australe]|uniref:Transposon Ty3-I Gag-Pol polyprotein n=1 Tax=Gossypium australe TaxID=47621 RepID=A0A5B6VKC7_9ROSI|nr:Transposon Ty3-I Gag-Pol polyprotein [Gossypium australe]